MTRNKAHKTAARQRMAATGEPYSVASRAVGTGDAEPGDPDRDEITPEERYAREAEAAGSTPVEIEAQLTAFHAQEAADRAQEAAGRARDEAGDWDAGDWDEAGDWDAGDWDAGDWSPPRWVVPGRRQRPGPGGMPPPPVPPRPPMPPRPPRPPR